MKKKISLLLVFILMFTMMGATFANEINFNSKTLDIVVENISEVNDLDKQQQELLRKSLIPIINNMSNEEKKEFTEGMKNLESDYQKEIKENDFSQLTKNDLISENKLNNLSRSTVDDAIIDFVFMGPSFPLGSLKWMMTCNSEGLEIIETAGDAVGWGSATLAWLTSAGVITTLPVAAAVAAAIGLAIGAHILSIKFQLLFDDFAIVYL
jgi:hypothetical protein